MRRIRRLFAVLVLILIAWLALSPAGRQVLLANRRRRDEWLAVRIAGLDPAEREILRRAIRVLEKVNQG